MKNLRLSILFVCVFAVLSVGWKTNPAKESARVDFGKIYLTDQHLFVSELLKGVNIYDVKNMNAIKSVGYLTLDGNSDVVITDNILYADSYEDLLVFDISDISNPILLERIPNVFRVNRTQTPIVENMTYEESVGGLSGCAPGCAGSNNDIYGPELSRDNGKGGLGTGGSGNQTGQGGSMARFVINGYKLFCIDISDLIVFDIREPMKPINEGKVSIGFGIETLFFYEDYLFVGSSTGMHIFDARDIRIPVKVSEFRHARACDPVVVEGTRAYVTLRSGVRCGPIDDALHVVDITDLKNPKLLTSYLMEGPSGLAVDNGIAYVCDKHKVSILDAQNISNIKEISSLPLENTYDTILDKNILVVVSPMGIYIYHVSDVKNPVLAAHISNIR